MTLPLKEDYIASIQQPNCIIDPKLIGGHPIKSKLGRLNFYAGGFNLVFPYVVNSSKYAVRCWIADIGDAKRRTESIANYLKTLNLPYFVEFNYVENGLATPAGSCAIVRMEWVNGLKIKDYIEENINNSSKLFQLAESFKDMVRTLHQHSIAHGDLQHGNIIVDTQGQLILVDYDSMCVPDIKGLPDTIKGLPGYQHPSRNNNQIIYEHLDYFSEMVFYLSILAIAEDQSLWDDLKIAHSETMLFTSDDILSKGQSPIFDRLLNMGLEVSTLTKHFIEFCKADDLLHLKKIEDIPVFPWDFKTQKVFPK